MIRWLKRALLAAEIRDMEADLAGIKLQRANDEAAEIEITRELAVARRHLQSMAFENITSKN